ncbi:MAG: molecular chaperone HtpG [Chlamydiales bacterium]|nr:molecular chaperone HtpG [Chlamydiales bacterium]
MTTKQLKIHSENILPILKKWLYSEHEIFVRELISNACDAIAKLNLLGVDGGEHRIDVTIDKKKKTLTFSDTGLGMTAEEVEKYIAQLAFSGAEDFIQKYSDKGSSEQIIGHFGLGFYSSYMVAHTVEIDTLSYLEDAKAAHWLCDGSSDYTLDEGKREKRGTTITLHIEDEDYLEESKLKEILKRFCSYLPAPIYLGEERINPSEPLWLKNPSDCTDQEYIDFYRELYPMDQDPIFWIHLSVDYPFHLQGILYFPKITRRMDIDKSSIQLYCNRVFVSDNCRDIIPDYLMVLRGAIDSPDIPLNVSRSTLQVDRNVRQLMSHISKKVADKLSSLYKNERDEFLKRWPDIELIIKLGALQDDKFYERIKDLLVFQNTSGDWTTIKDYLERSESKHKDKIFYTSQEQSHTLPLYTSKGIEVLKATSTIDTPVISMLEHKCSPAKFTRIDGSIDDAILDAAREKSTLDESGKSQSAQIADFFRKQLDGVEVEAKSLHEDSLPAFVVLDENMRRLRDTMSMHGQDMGAQFDKRTFVVNTNSPLIEALTKTQDESLAKELTQHLYELSLLGQRELKGDQIQGLIERANKLLTQLVK